jgi:hypothetical protein
MRLTAKARRDFDEPQSNRAKKEKIWNHGLHGWARIGKSFLIRAHP